MSMASTAKWGIEQVSEDLYDYARDDYDYTQIQLLNENFKPAPPISVAEYRARTSKILPQGIFDENDVPGIICNGKEMKIGPPQPVLESSFKELRGNSVVDNATVLSDGKAKGASNQMNSLLKDDKCSQNVMSNQAKNQKKKKKKFKKLEFNNTEPCKIYNVPFVPDRLNNDKMYPPL
ncbi:uncharacterized protein LOC123316760 [Coccinella septempunctata]|uniref:uncharacterized protein LOC123316760 n=1 Tax=Coccinella septempunctata TaxID=41139 RepID=UPI001D07FDF1|nr:uncharacterized protein LOC123316760 [Coccinella septempunctata]